MPLTGAQILKDIHRPPVGPPARPPRPLADLVVLPHELVGTAPQRAALLP
jgi:hypothetical protein